MLSRASYTSQYDDMWSCAYHKAISLLMYVALGMHPDITFAVSFLSQLCILKATLEAVKEVFRYLRGTHHHSLVISDGETWSGLETGKMAYRASVMQLGLPGHRHRPVAMSSRWWWDHVLELEETGHCCPLNNRGQICLIDACHERGPVDMCFPHRDHKATPHQPTVLWQSVSHCHLQKQSISCTHQAHWYPAPFICDHTDCRAIMVEYCPMAENTPTFSPRCCQCPSSRIDIDDGTALA